jgi:hypothetical protein
MSAEMESIMIVMARSMSGVLAHHGPRNVEMVSITTVTE